MPEHDLADQRRIVALYLGQMEEAAAFHEDWLTTPPDPDRACETHRTIDEAAEAHDWERAVRYAVPVLDGTWTCEDQPANVEAMTLVPMLLSGRPERAWSMQLDAYLTHRRDGAERGWLREHLAFLALSGHVYRGLRILRRHAGATAECGVAADLLELLTGSVMILRAAVRAGRGAERLGAAMPRATLGLSGHHVEATDSISEALEITTLWLDAVCDAFDERNGNRAVGDATRRYRDLEPVAEPVPGPVVHLLREPEPLPAALASTRLEEAPAPAETRAGTYGRALAGAPVAEVELQRREERINEVLDSAGPARAVVAARVLAEDLRQAGRNLEALAVVEMGIDIAAGHGARRGAGRADLLGRERYLRRAARSRLAFASAAVRRGQADVVDQLLELAEESVKALGRLGDASLVAAEREALEADRAWVAERTGRAQR